MSKSVRNKCLVFSGTAGRRGNLFADLNRVVIIGSPGVGKRIWRQDEGCRSDVKNLRESCSRRSTRLGMLGQYNALMWYGGRPQPRGLWVRWRPSPLAKKGRIPKFSAHVYCGQTAGWIKMALDMEVGLSLGDFVLDGDPALSPKGCGAPNFRPCMLRPRLRGSRCHLVLRYASAHTILC